MGRNKETNKLRKRTNHNINRNNQDGGDRGTRGNTRGKARSTAEQGQGSSGRDERKRGPCGRLSGFLVAYPFIAITVMIGMPRLFPLCARWIRLRSGLMGPAVDVHEEKQVLIMGTMGSGTTQMSRELARLGLEVGHETSDSVNEPCRDGTISWAHAIRFLRGTPNLTFLCSGPRFHAYHTTMFRPSESCSYLWRSWDRCWANECREVTSREFGCALEGGGKAGTDGSVEKGTACSTPFQKTLLQVRHPLRIVASLAYKSSSSKEAVGVDCRNGKQQLAAITALFPNKVVRENLGGRRSGAFSEFNWAQASSTCTQTWAWYWVIYNRAVLPVVEGWYRVEDTPPSRVAVLAGFSGSAIDKALESADEGEGPGQGELHGYHNQKNVGGFKVTWEDIAAYPGGLLREMSDLAIELGYEGAPGLPHSDSVTEGGEQVLPNSGGGDVESDRRREKGWKGLFGKLWGPKRGRRKT